MSLRDLSVPLVGIAVTLLVVLLCWAAFVLFLVYVIRLAGVQI